MNSKITITLSLLSCLGLLACSHTDEAKEKAEFITVSAHPIQTTLYYTGVIQPIQNKVITTPAEGVVDDMNFHYGDVVKRGQVLFMISSEKFISDYKNAMMQFVKAKSDFNTRQNLLKESEFLYKNELISSDALKDKKTDFYNAQLSYLQAKDTLDEMVKRLDLRNMNLSELKIEDIDKLMQVFHVQGDAQKLKILAEDTGVILIPQKNDGGSDTSLPRISRGEQVKQGEVLAMIGNMSGLRIRVNVNEFNVNQLSLGQLVTVTGSAFPDIKLQGEIAAIDRQAQTGQGGSPIFPVDVIIPKLTTAQQNVIHVGMSAKVAVQIDGGTKITLPIAAVFEKNNADYVKVKDKTGHIKEAIVHPGQTTLNEVIINDGVNVGDQVLVMRSLSNEPVTEG